MSRESSRTIIDNENRESITEAVKNIDVAIGLLDKNPHTVTLADEARKMRDRLVSLLNLLNGEA
jgi:hypothetical protein